MHGRKPLVMFHTLGLVLYACVILAVEKALLVHISMVLTVHALWQFGLDISWLLLGASLWGISGSSVAVSGNRLASPETS